jgi:hypothetical protein
MLEWLRDKASAQTATARKLRLFACACCRRVWDRLADERSRLAVEINEQYADGLVTDQQLAVHASAATAAAYAWGKKAYAPAYAIATSNLVQAYDAWDYAGATAEAVREQLMVGEGERSWAIAKAEKCGQTALLRDIFGNPFRPVSLDRSRLTDVVITLARSLYGERRFQDLPILADALEEAGCTNADLLTHCRQPSEHVLGCWALDVLLGKE